MARRLGRHLLADYFGVAPARLRDARALMGALRRALVAEGFDIRRSASHTFQGGGRGVTGFFLLAQSHAAFHSYPEYGYLALDIYCCGNQEPRVVARALRHTLRPRRVEYALRPRGTRTF